MKRSRKSVKHLSRAGDTAALMVGIGLGLTLVLEVISFTAEDLAKSSLTIAAGFAALTGTYLLLVGLLLVARIPWVERSIGHDRMVTWHGKLGPWSLYLILLHVIPVVIGYSGNDGIPVHKEFWNMVTTYSWMLPALVGFILMIATGVTSNRKARAKMSYETWWIIHLYNHEESCAIERHGYRTWL